VSSHLVFYAHTSARFFERLESEKVLSDEDRMPDHAAVVTLRAGHNPS
jgi:hypothetical protein